MLAIGSLYTRQSPIYISRPGRRHGVVSNGAHTAEYTNLGIYLDIVFFCSVNFIVERCATPTAAPTRPRAVTYMYTYARAQSPSQYSDCVYMLIMFFVVWERECVYDSCTVQVCTAVDDLLLIHVRP